MQLPKIIVRGGLANLYRVLAVGIILSLVFSMQTAFTQDRPAYRLFDGKGKSISYRKAMREIAKSDVVLFGELHNDPIAHWLQFEMLRDLAANSDRALAVGLEMFETHQMEMLTRLQDGEIDEEQFADSTELWPNYATDYRPFVNFALQNGIPVVATNAPRRLARLVARGGLSALDSLPPADRALIVPLPLNIDYELPSYLKMQEMLSGHGHGMKPEDFVAAQALKDATMAQRILANLPENGQLVHLNGSYHSDYKEGIAWYLTQQRPDLEIVNLSVVSQASLDELEEEHEGKADVIIVVPESMTKTY